MKSKVKRKKKKEISGRFAAGDKTLSWKASPRAWAPAFGLSEDYWDFIVCYKICCGNIFQLSATTKTRQNRFEKQPSNPGQSNTGVFFFLNSCSLEYPFGTILLKFHMPYAEFSHIHKIVFAPNGTLHWKRSVAIHFQGDPAVVQLWSLQPAVTFDGQLSGRSPDLGVNAA